MPADRPGRLSRRGRARAARRRSSRSRCRSRARTSSSASRAASSRRRAGGCSSRPSGRCRDEFKLAVAGDGPDLGALLEALPGRVHSAGLLPKDDLWSFYAALDCLAIPSLTTPRWKEQLGGTLLDGLAMGVPVVASASGGLPDAMGDAGLLVPEGDAVRARGRVAAASRRPGASRPARRSAVATASGASSRSRRTRTRSRERSQLTARDVMEGSADRLHLGTAPGAQPGDRLASTA